MNKRLLTAILCGIILAVVVFSGVAIYNFFQIYAYFNLPPFDFTSDKIAVLVFFDGLIMATLFGVIVPELKNVTL